MFDFHKLSVYQKARNVNKEILIFILNSKEINKSLRDQLIRSISSMMLNIAEGSGRNTSKDKKNFYVIARGSIYESIALLDIFIDLKYIDKEIYKHFYIQLEEITKMLFGLIKSLDGKK
jgi:four helix bundle protein